MYFWYSLSVVAPIRFSSPRASAGLKVLAMSRPPSPPPWPALDDGVDLVDEQDQAVLLLGDLLEDLLDSLLELAAILRPGHHRVDVELDQPLVAQRLGHFARDDPLCKSLDDGGLAHAGLADQHRVVLFPAGERFDRRLEARGRGR
jgi:hypothetical protein